MALTFVTGSVQLPNSIGALAEIPATLPMLVFCRGTYQTAAAAVTNVSSRWGFGFASFRGGSVQQHYVASWQTDEVSDMVYGESRGSDACYCTMASDATIDCKVTVTADADGVTFTVADAPATNNIRMEYVIIGGTDVTDAYAHAFTTSTAVATQDIDLSAEASGIGNPGDGEGWLSLFATAFRTTAGQAGGDIGIGFGADSGTERAFCLWGGDDAGGASNNAVWLRASGLLGFTGTAGTADFAAQIDSTGHPADGFQLAFTDQATLVKSVIAVHIRGDFGKKIGQQATRTSTGTQDIAAVFAETIRGVITFGTSEPTSLTPTTNTTTSSMVNIGSSDFATEVACGTGDDDGLGFSNPSSTLSLTQSLYGHGQPNSEDAALTLLYAADASISGTDVRYTYTTANATARDYGFLILGDAPAAAAEVIPQLMMAPYQGAF